MRLETFQEILRRAEEIAITENNPVNKVLAYLRENKVNATPEMAFEFVDDAVGRFENK